MTTETVAMKIGSRWASAVCETEVIVVAAPTVEITLECGGHPMVAKGEDAPGGLEVDAAHGTGTVIGKRYEDPASGLEVLCTKAGDGSLSVGGTPLALKAPKQLPSSD